LLLAVAEVPLAAAPTGAAEVVVVLVD